jgi:hypothetical protein
MMVLKNLIITTSLIGVFISSVVTAKLRFAQSYGKVQEIQERQQVYITSVNDYIPPRNLALFNSGSLKKVRYLDFVTGLCM